MSSSSVKQCALCASSTHDVHHAIVGVNVVIGVLVVHCELLVVRVVPVVICDDDAAVRRTLGLIAFIVAIVFVVAIFHRILLYWRYSVYRMEGESRWLGVWRGWAESHTAVSSGTHMGWRRRREWRDGVRSGERRIPESKGLSWSDTKPFLASKCGASCGGGSGALAREVQIVWPRQTMGSRPPRPQEVPFNCAV